MFTLIILVGVFQSWSLALTILNYCLISAVMTIGANIQWGYAGLFSVGTTGFVALGGVAAVITSMPPVREAWAVLRQLRQRVVLVTRQPRADG